MLRFESKYVEIPKVGRMMRIEAVEEETEEVVQVWYERLPEEMGPGDTDPVTQLGEEPIRGIPILSMIVIPLLCLVGMLLATLALASM